MLLGEAFGIVDFDVDEFTVFVVNGRIYRVYKTFVRFDIELCVAVAYLLVDSPIDAYAVVFDQVVWFLFAVLEFAKTFDGGSVHIVTAQKISVALSLGGTFFKITVPQLEGRSSPNSFFMSLISISIIFFFMSHII